MALPTMIVQRSSKEGRGTLNARFMFAIMVQREFDFIKFRCKSNFEVYNINTHTHTQLMRNTGDAFQGRSLQNRLSYSYTGSEFSTVL